MKKLLLLATVLIGLTAGCKKNTMQPTVEPTIVSKWYATQYIVTDYTVSPKHLTIKNYPNQNTGIMFKSDGTGEVIINSSVAPMKYSVNGNGVKVTYDPPSNQVFNFEVAELSTSRLILLEVTKKDNTGKTTETYETWYTRIQ